MTYSKKSKHEGHMGFLPISDAMERLLRNEIRRGGECDFVFTYLCEKSRGERRKGKRYPITTDGLKSEMQRAVELAGLKDWRLIHDLRHTAATETLRSSQNLAVVQTMLGHSNVNQTSRYAHVLNRDLRNAMNLRRR